MLFSVPNIAGAEVYTLGERVTQRPEAEQSAVEYHL